jgi:hypothetical protein
LSAACAGSADAGPPGSARCRNPRAVVSRRARAQNEPSCPLEARPTANATSRATFAPARMKRPLRARTTPRRSKAPSLTSPPATLRPSRPSRTPRRARRRPLNPTPPSSASATMNCSPKSPAAAWESFTRRGRSASAASSLSK